MSVNQVAGFWAVAAALAGNLFVSCIKLAGATASGSSVMFSEAIHSIADTTNQVLLMVGLVRSRRAPDEEFAYGYGRERFFWALLSACGVFFIGAGVTLYHGLETLLHPASVELSPFLFTVLAVSFVIEAGTFLIATWELRRANPTLSWREQLERGDPATLSVYFEDGIAVVGVLIATAAIALSYLTGSALWDALGSLAVGLLLAVAAVMLIMKNRGYLIGMAMPEEMQEEVVEFLTADPAIERVLDFKSTTLDVGVYRLKCEVEINGPALLDEYFQQTLSDEFDEIDGDYESFKRFAVQLVDRVPRLIGRRVDELEETLKVMNPGIRHIDIEVN